jgi:iron complex transport system substrate-binding protein
MRRRGFAGALLAFAVALLPFAAAAQTRFTDDGGRSVTLPARIEHVMPAGPPASADLLMLAPEKLVGLTRALTPAQAAYLRARDGALPGLGRLRHRSRTAGFRFGSE